MSLVRRAAQRGRLRCVSADELLPGRATAEGTRRYADRFANLPGHFRSPDQLWLSSLGLGTKSGGQSGADDLLYRGSIPRALAGGINVFDTALSYRMQASERTLGSALRRALAEDVARRDEVFVITKGGYLTLDPDSPLARQGGRYLIETYVETGLIDPARVVNGVHSLDPRFIADQIERSRRNLGLETIDLYCIQQPELQLVERGPDEFKGILRALFATLEEAVARGDIAAYGLSTWTGLLLPHLERGHLAIAELLELALDVGGPDHHMRALQLPYSVAMESGVRCVASTTRRRVLSSSSVMSILIKFAESWIVTWRIPAGRFSAGTWLVASLTVKLSVSPIVAPKIMPARICQ